MINDNLSEAEIKELVKSTPGSFAVIISSKKYKTHYQGKNKRRIPIPHLEKIDVLLRKVVDGEIKRLIINMPPRHGKSELISKYFPAWFLCKFPDKRVILAAYGSSLAVSFGRKIRNLLKGNSKFFNIELDPASCSVHSFSIKGHDGGMDSVGVGGAITGKGADLLIIDDPVKNYKEANSQTHRDNIWEWFISTAYTRIEPDGAIIIVMTRWHDDDLCGRLLNKSYEDIKDKWEFLCLPAIAELDDPLERNAGDALWKRRFNLKKLLSIKNQLGNYWFSALYQQRPSPMGGGIFKRSFFKYYSDDNEFYYLYHLNLTKIDSIKFRKSECSIYASMDLAVTQNQTSDYTVIILFAVTKMRDVLILDIIRDRFQGADHLNLLKRVYERFKPSIIGIESTQYQVTLVQSALREGLPVKKLKPDADKVTRALAMQARVEAGTVYFKSEAAWLNEFEQELLMFPNVKHDDQTDAFSYIAKLIEPVSNNAPAAANVNTKTKKSITRGFES
ncbi:MAG: phage terminase large subunit [Candidatus Kapabacteria bacterium]|nr:phage terminase large subunit [Candidatus Kapabacteria bacterium]